MKDFTARGVAWKNWTKIIKDINARGGNATEEAFVEGQLQGETMPGSATG